jgi:26S proteasome regulatory subunit N2
LYFIFRTPEQFPSVVSLLAESYNPYVRCGAAMALGLACAGTGNKVQKKNYLFIYLFK